MKIIDEIKALWAFRSTGQAIYKEATTMNGTTSGWRTSEFWLNVAAQIGTLWGAVSGFIPPKYAAIISTAGIAVYTVARTVLKARTDIKAGLGSETATATATVSAK